MHLLFHVFGICYLSTKFSLQTLQIPQIDYSHGASIILNLSSSKKQHVFGFYSLIEVLNCLHLCVYSFVYLIIFLFCLESFSLWMFFDVFPSLDFLYLLSISLSSLFLVYSLFYVFFCLYFVLFLDLSMYLQFIYWLLLSYAFTYSSIWCSSFIYKILFTNPSRFHR